MPLIYRIAILAMTICLVNSACEKKKNSRQPIPRPTTSAAPTDVQEDSLDDKSTKPTLASHDEGEEDRIEMIETSQERSGGGEGDYRPLPGPTQADGISSGGSERSEPRYDTTEGTQSRNAQCGTAYRRNHTMWAPGLPQPPSETLICTGSPYGRHDIREQFSCDKNAGLIYTDARQDGLMAMVVDRINSLPAQMDLGSRELGLRINNVKVRGVRSDSVEVEIALLVDRDQVETIIMKGQRSRSRRDIRLRTVSGPRNLPFSGLFTCADVGSECHNSLIRLEQLTRSGKVGRVAYIVYRHGDAHVTMTEQDRIGHASISNGGHKQFAGYLSNTVYNSCVSVLGDVLRGLRQVPECSYQRLKDQCGHSARFRFPAAKAFNFTSWAVAYGKAAFEFEMVDEGRVRFSVRGPLVTGPETPVYQRDLTVDGSFSPSIERAILVANDGGGNLNLQIDFAGSPKSHTRVSVTTLMDDVRFNSERIMEQARQMPDISPDQIADENERREEGMDMTAPQQSGGEATPVRPRESEDNETIQPKD